MAVFPVNNKGSTLNNLFLENPQKGNKFQFFWGNDDSKLKLSFHISFLLGRKQCETLLTVTISSERTKGMVAIDVHVFALLGERQVTD